MENLIDNQVHQELTKRACKDRHWAEYLLLLQAAKDMIGSVPASVEACKEVDIYELLIADLDRFAMAIRHIFPRGIEEFASFGGSWQRNGKPMDMQEKRAWATILRKRLDDQEEQASVEQTGE